MCCENLSQEWNTESQYAERFTLPRLRQLALPHRLVQLVIGWDRASLDSGASRSLASSCIKYPNCPKQSGRAAHIVFSNNLT